MSIETEDDLFLERLEDTESVNVRTDMQYNDTASESMSDQDINVKSETPGVTNANNLETEPLSDIDLDEVRGNTANTLENQSASAADYIAVPLTLARSPSTIEPYLPYLVLRQIIVFSIQMHPLMRYTLQRVSAFFEATVVSLGYPALHLNPEQMHNVPRIVSVRRLSRVFGSHSGVMLRLRNIMLSAGGRWFNAWLTLQEMNYDWYEIRDISWT